MVLWRGAGTLGGDSHLAASSLAGAEAAQS